jgi:succinate dehydrogenase hydrophobic anchor subunit
MKQLIFTTVVHLCGMVLILATGLFFDWPEIATICGMAVAPIGVTLLSVVFGGRFIMGLLKLAFPYFGLSMLTMFSLQRVKATMEEKGEISSEFVFAMVVSGVVLIAYLLFFAFFVSEILGEDEEMYRRWAIVPPSVFSFSSWVSLYFLPSFWSWIPLGGGIALLLVLRANLKHITYEMPGTCGGGPSTYTAPEEDDYHRWQPPY